MNTSIIEKQLMEMSDYEKKYSGTPEHPRHYSHLEDLELTFLRAFKHLTLYLLIISLILIKMLYF